MPFNLTISPAQTEFVMKPGITITQAYTVENNSDTSLSLTANVAPWIPDGNDGSVNYENAANVNNFEFSLMNSDLTLDKSFILKPKEKKQLVLKIKSPATQTTPDSYFTFFINQDSGGITQSDTTASSALGRLGSHILISTSATEDLKNELTPTNFTISSKVIDTFFPSLTIDGLIHNPASFFTKIDGKIVVSKNNRSLEEITLFPHNILSSSDRKISCLKDNIPVPCILHPPYWPGIYSLNLNLTNGKSTSLKFYSFPFSLLTIIVFGLGLYFYFRRSKTR